MAYLINSGEYLDIAGVPLQTPAWTLTNLQELWSGPQTRGSDRLIPGAAGIRSYRRRATATTRPLALVIFGEWKWDGTAHTSPRVGLQDNISHLKTNLSDPTVANPGTRTATLHLPSGATKTGAVTVEGFELGEALGSWNITAVMDITIAQGALA